MSDKREGYYQCLCANGHLTQYDAFLTTGNELTECRICKAQILHQNFVDDSTGEELGKIEFVLVEEVKCSECGHTTDRRYRLP